MNFPEKLNVIIIIALEIDLKILIFFDKYIPIDQVLIQLPSHLMTNVRKFNLGKKLNVFDVVSESQNAERPFMTLNSIYLNVSSSK